MEADRSLESVLSQSINVARPCRNGIGAADIVPVRRKRLGSANTTHERQIVASFSVVDHVDHIHQIIYQFVRVGREPWALDSFRYSSHADPERLRPLVLDRSAVGLFLIGGKLRGEKSRLRMISSDGRADADSPRAGFFLLAIERAGRIELPVRIEIWQEDEVRRGAYPDPLPWPTTDPGLSRTLT